MKHSIETKVGTFEIDTAKVSKNNLEVACATKFRHMLKNEVDSHMLSWSKANPKATKEQTRNEHVAAINKMVDRIYNSDLTVKASPVRLSPVEKELRELLEKEVNRRAVANGGTQMRGDALKAAIAWLNENDSETVAKLRKTAEQKTAGVDKIARKAADVDIAALMGGTAKAA